MPADSDVPDLLLVERARARDVRAFETLMRRYNRRLYRIARSILTDDEGAEAVVRATHVRALTNLDSYEPGGKFGTWLTRLAFNEALAARRRSSSSPLASRDAAAQSPPAAEIDEAALERQQLEDAVDALPQVFRTVFVLRVVEQLSGVEVAVCLGLNETTVRTRLYRAQQRLQADVARRVRARGCDLFELSTVRADRLVAQVLASDPKWLYPG